jgi:hypothetical protein
VATPLALVEDKPNFDKNPRLATVVGFFMLRRSQAPKKGINEQND